MTIESIVGWLGGAVGIIAALFTLYANIRKTPKDLRRADIDAGAQAVNTTANAIDIANDAAAQVKAVREEMAKQSLEHKKELSSMREEMRINETKAKYEIDGMRLEIDELKYELECERVEKSSFAEYVNELVRQIVTEFKGKPVKMKPVVLPVRD